MKYKYYAVVQDINGNAIGGASVSVYLAGTTTPVNVYTSPSDTTGINTPPQLTTRSDGVVEFWLEHSEYSYGQLFKIVVQSGSLSKTLDNVQIINWATTPYTVDATGAVDYQVVVFNVTGQKLQPGTGVYVKGGGNVGIGTSSPYARLDVRGGQNCISWGDSAQNVLMSDQGGSIELGGRGDLANPVNGGRPYIDFHYGNGLAQDFNVRIINFADNRLDFASAGQGTFVTFNAGNVGIGTVAPSAKLHVVGNAVVSSGNVGIGTTNPAGSLDVYGFTVSDYLVEINGCIDVAKGVTPTISAGTLYNGGPTFRGQNSQWYVSSFPASLTLDFGSTVQQIRMIVFGASWRGDVRVIPYNYSIDYSSDGSTWTNVVYVTGNTAAQVRHSVSFDARYIRLTVSAPQPNYTYVIVSGLQVLAKSGSALYGTNPWGANGDNIFTAVVGNVGIGTVAPSAKLHVGGDAIISGAFSTKVTTVTANTTLDNTYHIVLANAANGAITITLPSASTCAGRQYVIKKIDSSTNAVTISPQSGQTIDGQTSVSITAQNDLRRIVSNGTNWYII